MVMEWKIHSPYMQSEKMKGESERKLNAAATGQNFKACTETRRIEATKKKEKKKKLKTTAHFTKNSKNTFHFQ